MRGRPRKSDEIKILTGSFRDDRAGGAAQTADGEPLPPKHLKGEALKFWKEIAPELVANGVAKRIDSAELALMCEWWARYRKWGKKLDAYKNFGDHLMGLQNQVASAFKQFDKIAARFGITPADRARLRVADKPKAGVMSRKRQA